MLITTLYSITFATVYALQKYKSSSSDNKHHKFLTSKLTTDVVK